MSKKENDHEKTIHENNDSDNTKKKNVKAEKKTFTFALPPKRFYLLMSISRCIYKRTLFF